MQHHRRVHGGNHTPADVAASHSPCLSRTAMKVPISEFALVSADAPVLPAYEANRDGVIRWVIWCRHCEAWH